MQLPILTFGSGEQTGDGGTTIAAEARQGQGSGAAHVSVLVLEQLSQGGGGTDRVLADASQGERGRTAHVHLGILEHDDQGGHGGLRVLTDTAQRQGRRLANLRILVFQRVGERLDGFGRIGLVIRVWFRSDEHRRRRLAEESVGQLLIEEKRKHRESNQNRSDGAQIDSPHDTLMNNAG